MKTVRLRRWVCRISASRKWNPIHPSQRFNFPRDNGRTCYLGQDLRVSRAEVFGRQAGLVPLKCYWARARVNVTVWDLRKPGAELGKALGRWVRDRRHTWAVKALANRTRRQGVQGILYTSTRDPKRWCLVLFQENVSPSEFRRERWQALP
jgi:hypothetical protein